MCAQGDKDLYLTSQGILRAAGFIVVALALANELGQRDGDEFEAFLRGLRGDSRRYRRRIWS